MLYLVSRGIKLTLTNHTFSCNLDQRTEAIFIFQCLHVLKGMEIAPADSEIPCLRYIPGPRPGLNSAAVLALDIQRVNCPGNTSNSSMGAIPEVPLCPGPSKSLL